MATWVPHAQITVAQCDMDRQLHLFLQCVQIMYIFLCCYAIWDVGGVWSWLVVAQRKTIKAVASYNAKGNLSHVFSISRQGFHHTFPTLVASTASQMQMTAPVNAFGEDLATPKKILELTRAVMGSGFSINDSLCKLCQMPL